MKFYKLLKIQRPGWLGWRTIQDDKLISARVIFNIIGIVRMKRRRRKLLHKLARRQKIFGVFKILLIIILLISLRPAPARVEDGVGGASELTEEDNWTSNAPPPSAQNPCLLPSVHCEGEIPVTIKLL